MTDDLREKAAELCKALREIEDETTFSLAVLDALVDLEAELAWDVLDPGSDE